MLSFWPLLLKSLPSYLHKTPDSESGSQEDFTHQRGRRFGPGRSTSLWLRFPKLLKFCLCCCHLGAGLPLQLSDKSVGEVSLTTVSPGKKLFLLLSESREQTQQCKLPQQAMFSWRCGTSKLSRKYPQIPLIYFQEGVQCVKRGVYLKTWERKILRPVLLCPIFLSRSSSCGHTGAVILLASPGRAAAWLSFGGVHFFPNEETTKRY